MVAQQPRSNRTCPLCPYTTLFRTRHGLKGARRAASAVEGGDAQRGDGPSVTARCAQTAFEQAGLGPNDVSLAEVHDPTAPDRKSTRLTSSHSCAARMPYSA